MSETNTELMAVLDSKTSNWREPTKCEKVAAQYSLNWFVQKLKAAQSGKKP